MNNNFIHKLLTELQISPVAFYISILGSLTAVLYVIKQQEANDKILINIIATIFGGIFLGAYSHALIFEISDKSGKWAKATNLITFGIAYISIHVFNILKSDKIKELILLVIDFVKTKIKKYLNIK